ncbi:MAG: ABC transporter substrate-binding protein [Syntrophales bacterium]
MNRILIRLALGTLVLMIGAGYWACSRGDHGPAAKPEKVTIACATPPYTVLVDIAVAKGYFGQDGLEITPRFHSTGKEALEELLAGKADFATVAETPIMFAVLSGSKISIIATIQSSDKANAIVARKDKGIHLPRDLKGKQVAASIGTISEYFLHAFLATYSVAGKDVKVINLKPEEMPQALTNGEVDAASMFLPFQIQAQQMLGDKGIIFYEKDIYKQTFNLIAVQNYAKKNPVIIKKALLALLKAGEFARNYPAEAQKVVSDFRQVDKTVLAAAWPVHTFDVSLDQSLLLALEDESDWAIKNKLTGAMKVPNYLECIYFDGLQRVKPDAVRIVR